MKIKIKGRWYQTAKIPKYNNLVSKLEHILKGNRNEKEYFGIRNKGKIGVLVKGIGNLGISDFQRFYSINDINYYFYKNERLKNLGKRQPK